MTPASKAAEPAPPEQGPSSRVEEEMAAHRVDVVEGRNDTRCYAQYGARLIGPFENREKAGEAINRAATVIAIEYAGLSITAEEALNATFGTDDLDTRDSLSHQYYSAALRLLDGAEHRILDRLREDDEELEDCHHWTCTRCADEWTGTDSHCYNCESLLEIATCETIENT